MLRAHDLAQITFPFTIFIPPLASSSLPESSDLYAAGAPFCPLAPSASMSASAMK
jgi:hypothetical protein